jgi:hypothetical protein
MMYSISRVVAMLLLGATVLGMASGTANAQAKPALVRSVDEPARQPFQTNLLPNSSTSNSNAVYYQVPAGKRLVIEYISAQAQDLSGTGGASLTLGTTAGGNFVSYFVFIGATDNRAYNQATRIYADPGTYVQAFVFNGSGTTHCGSSLNISGYLVDVP